jgi:transposase-like protein
MASPHNCPRCGSFETFRSHRKPVEYLLLGFRAFSCIDCKSRFHTFEFRKILSALRLPLPN